MDHLELLSDAIATLKSGGAVLHPTETCYGLAADALNKKAVRHVYDMKRMPTDKPVSIMVPSIEVAREIGVFDARAQKLARQFWPGPLTIIVKRTAGLPSFLNPGCATVGIRYPDHAFTLEMLRRFGGPLVTTSANKYQEAQAYAVSDFLAQCPAAAKSAGSAAGSLLCVVDMGLIPEILPSTVVDCSGEKLKVVRSGPIPADELYTFVMQ